MRMRKLDIILTVTLIIIFLPLSYWGGSQSWAGDTDILPFIMMAVGAIYLIFENIRLNSPFLGMWLGVLLGLAMTVPSALVYEAGLGEDLIILVIFGLFGLMSSRIFWSRSFWSRILIVGGALDSYLRTSASDPSRNEIVPNGQEASFVRTKEGPVGIGGWLILPTIGIVLAPFYHMGSIIARLQSPELYEDAVKLHIIGDAALLVLAVLVGFSLFAGKRRTPTLIITYYLCTTAFFALMACIYGSMGIELKNQVPFMLVALAGQVITCAIWIPYFAKSRRVKATFNDRSISLQQADKLIVHGREDPLINLKNDGRE